MKVINLLIIFCVALISGCVSGNYQSYENGIGYNSVHQADNVYVVDYTGSASTKVEKVNDFALLRSAELTLSEGYEYFVIVEAVNNKNEVKNPGGVQSGMLTNSALKIPTGDKVFKVKPKSTLTIHCYKEKPEGIAYNARMIDHALKEEYEIGASEEL